MTFDEAKRALDSGMKIRQQGQKGYLYLEDGYMYYKYFNPEGRLIYFFTEKNKRATDWEIVDEL